MTAKKSEVKEVIEPVKVVEVEVIEEVKLSYQEQLNIIDNQMQDLQEQKKKLSKLMLEEMENQIEMPLAQLNAIGRIGYEKAKKSFGKDWVE